MQDAGERSPKYQYTLQKYPTNISVFKNRLRNDLMQFNINQVCDFKTSLLCMVLLLSPLLFIAKTAELFSSRTSLHKHIPPLLGKPVPGSKKMADILKFVSVLNVKCGEIANILFLKSLEYKCPFTVSY